MTAENLYHAVILDHARSPRNRREIDDADHTAVGHNPLCGDRMTVFLQMQNEQIEQAAFMNEGCAISTASASIMTQRVEGKTQAEALRLYAQLQEWLSEGPPPPEASEQEPLLSALAGVREYPMRIKCALLAWKTLDAALKGQSGIITTE